MHDQSLPYLAVGYALFWALVGAYVVRLWVVHRRVVRRLDELEQKSASSESR
jgi:uncharacterized membrane protein YciS (DUF1049 family)